MLVDRPNAVKSSAELKAWWDSSPEEVRVSFNALIDSLLSSATGDSGAHNIGSASIAGVSGSTVFAQISDLKTQLQQTSLGQIADGTITVQKLAFDPATQVELNNVNRMVSMGGML